jgi:signal transduction histidine kinase
MGRRLTVLLMLLVVLPTGLLAWLAIRGVRDERRRVADQLEAAAASRLADVDARIARLLDDRARALDALAVVAPRDADGWRQLVRQTPEVAQVAIQDADGSLLFPPVASGISESERAFLRRIRAILTEGRLLDESSRPQKADRQLKSSSPAGAVHGWLAWYWDTGLHVLFWRRDPAGWVAAIELDRARLLADLLVELSAASGEPESTVSWGRMVLTDSQGRTLYQSGAPPEEGGEVGIVETRLSPPLAAWTLRAEYWQDGTIGALGSFLRAAVLVVVAAVLVGLAVVFYRESSRELREAGHRVRFVNQVSHELRTPLTNIRLYAELAERRLADDDETRAHLEVIVAESARLGRLIGNVLSFARSRRGELAVHPVEGMIDDVLRSVAAQFRPSLADRGIELVLDLAAPRPLAFDPDAVEQVMGNLLANVEKYAAAGGRADISSRQDDEVTTVRVADRGPGIPAGAEERVFEPFVRLSDRLTEGVSGTGIGLAIARELARAHGGELRLTSCDVGACFTLELPNRAEGGVR